MPEDLGEGLYLTGVGMGLVFLSLAVFSGVLFALRRFLPGEDGATATQETTPIGPTQEESPMKEEHASTEVGAQSAAIASQDRGRIPGGKIAAMAVSIYLAMEQEMLLEEAPAIAPAPTPAIPPRHDGWGVEGRRLLMASQGHRAPQYDAKLHSRYVIRAA